MKQLTKLLAHKAIERHGRKVYALARLYCNIENFTAMEAINRAVRDLENPSNVGYNLMGRVSEGKFKEYQKAYHRIT